MTSSKYESQCMIYRYKNTGLKTTEGYRNDVGSYVFSISSLLSIYITPTWVNKLVFFIIILILFKQLIKNGTLWSITVIYFHDDIYGDVYFVNFNILLLQPKWRHGQWCDYISMWMLPPMLWDVYWSQRIIAVQYGLVCLPSSVLVLIRLSLSSKHLKSFSLNYF